MCIAGKLTEEDAVDASSARFHNRQKDRSSVVEKAGAAHTWIEHLGG